MEEKRKAKSEADDKVDNAVIYRVKRIAPVRTCARQLAASPSATEKNESEFTFMSWNVLAQTMAERVECVWSLAQLYSLNWSRHRWPLLLHTIDRVDSDILSLQELQVVAEATLACLPDDDHGAQWHAALQARGFETHVVPRSDRGVTLAVAVAWRADKWRLCGGGRLGLGGNSLSAAERRFHDLMVFREASDRSASHVAAFVLLRSVADASAAPLLVISAHLSPLSGENGQWLRLYQAMVLRRFIGLSQIECGGRLAVLINGDFNAPPSEPAYALLAGDCMAALKHPLLQVGQQTLIL